MPSTKEQPANTPSWLPLVRGKSARPSTLLFLTCGGAGLSPFAPGTVGTLAAWIVVAALPQIPGYGWLILAVICFGLGAWLTDQAQAVTDVHDPGWVVMDEAVAYWLVYGILGGGLMEQTLIFFIFRFFDIVKPPPARKIDQTWQSGFGVMLDDVVAAIWTIPVVYLLVSWI